jgi:hypothetical protein
MTGLVPLFFQGSVSGQHAHIPVDDQNGWTIGIIGTEHAGTHGESQS